LNDVFQKFPTAANRIREHTIDRYKALIKKPMLQMRQEKLDELNLRSTYKIVKIEEKEESKIKHEEKIIEKKNNSKVQKEIKTKIDVIQDKMTQFLNRFKNFENINNNGFQGFVQKPIPIHEE
jgi:hypothetical protein